MKLWFIRPFSRTLLRAVLGCSLLLHVAVLEAGQREQFHIQIPPLSHCYSHSCSHSDSHFDRHNDTHQDLHQDNHNDGHTDAHADNHIDRNTDSHIDRHTDSHIERDVIVPNMIPNTSPSTNSPPISLERSAQTRQNLGYQLNPQSVFYLGYSDRFNANELHQSLRRTEQTYFIKLSYAWLLRAWQFSARRYCLLPLCLS